MSHLTNDPLVAFLYELTRDHVELNVVRDIVNNDAAPEATEGPTPWRLTDENRALFCVDLAASLRRRDPVAPAPEPSERQKK